MSSDATVDRHEAFRKAMAQTETPTNPNGERKGQQVRSPWSAPKTSPFKKKV